MSQIKSTYAHGRGPHYYKEIDNVIYVYNGDPDLIGAEAELTLALHKDLVPSLIASLQLAAGSGKAK